ncbi:MAG: glycerol-3-phosphate dehydrogenase/oxidase, partial [Longimicrobiaceae bacterium]
GARARDRFGGETVTARARLVLNATGPWLDHLRRMADPGVKPRLRPTQGVHLMVRRERLDIRSAVVFPSPVDGRVMFLLPWGAFAYLGTTDTDFTGDPGGVRHRPEDIDYLLASANGIAPAARLTRGDVLSSWAGVRPLLAEEEGTSAGQTSREHEIWRDPSGLLNAGGGKLTTFLSMAGEVVDQAAEVLKEEHGVEAHGAGSAREPLPGAPSEPWKSFLGRIERAARRVHLPDSTAEQLARAHGTGGFEVIERVRERTELAEPLVPGLPHLRAEVVHAVEKEMALTVEDVLRRRTHVFYQAPDGGVSAAAKTARWMHEAGVKRSRAAWDEQVAAYARGVRENRNFDG